MTKAPDHRRVSAPPRLRRDTIESPLGPFTLIVDDAGALICAGWYDDGDPSRDLIHQFAPRSFTFVDTTDPGGLSTAIAAYFAGDLAVIDHLPVAATGTPFQCAVWAALRMIPCGTTISYGALARRLNNPAAVRAVGGANGSNPVAVVVPCHRVIGANGTLTGYASGIDRKKWLLAHEAGQPAGTVIGSGRQMAFDL